MTFDHSGTGNSSLVKLCIVEIILFKFWLLFSPYSFIYLFICSHPYLHLDGVPEDQLCGCVLLQPRAAPSQPVLQPGSHSPQSETQLPVCGSTIAAAAEVKMTP